MTRVCIVSAKRTPQGRFLGALAKYSVRDLGVIAAKAALAGMDAALVELVIVGRVLPPDINVARQIARVAGLPESSSAFTVNMACASGMKAILLGADAIRLGQAEVALCGGAESMSQTPHILEGSRGGFKYGDAKLVDYLQVGLSDPLINEAMGQTAERLAEQYKVDRAAQDVFAYRSHQKAAGAQKAGAFEDELVKLLELDRDEHVRPETSIEKLGALKTAFGTPGTVTPGNASGINDGAAMVVLASEEAAKKHGWKPLAYIDQGTQVGCDPKIMGIGPAHAFKKLCARSGQKLAQFDTIEINEAFAAQAVACLRDLGLPDDEPRLNQEGGAVALGHPIGASGARLVVHLAHRVARGRSRAALAGLCVGGGMGIACTVGQ